LFWVAKAGGSTVTAFGNGLNIMKIRKAPMPIRPPQQKPRLSLHVKDAALAYQNPAARTPVKSGRQR
jgi:hypothetical protein